MYFPLTILTGLASVPLALSAPAFTANDPRTSVDYPTHCTNHHPAAANAIGKLCGGLDGPLIIGNNITTAASSPAYDHDPHPASVQIAGTCVDSVVTGVLNGPPSDESEVCMSVLWELCYFAVETARPVVYSRGRNLCQQWKMSGWGEHGLVWEGMQSLNGLMSI